MLHQQSMQHDIVTLRPTNYFDVVDINNNVADTVLSHMILGIRMRTYMYVCGGGLCVCVRWSFVCVCMYVWGGGLCVCV